MIPPIHRATHRVGLYLSDLRDASLSQGEAHILALLATSAPATIAELHRGLAHKRSTLTSILDRLAERRLITREVGKADRRTFVVMLTPEGRDVASRVLRHLIELEQAVGRRVTGDDVRGFLKVVRAVEDEAHRQTRARERRSNAGAAPRAATRVKRAGSRP
jgi:DNA-binding MarR family transcriptional regulator